MRNRILNVKSFMFLFVCVLLVYGVSDVSYGQVCEVGDMISPGGRCGVVGAKTAWFSVLRDGSSVYQEGELRLDSNERVHCGDFAASKQADGTWLIESIPSGFGTPARANPSDQIYWSQFSHFGGDNWGLWRGNLDGSNAERLLPWDVVGMEIDPTGGKIYLADPGGISRMNLDGSNLEERIVKLPRGWISGFALDTVGGKVYWIRSNSIYRANLDGSNVEGFGDLFGDLGESSVYQNYFLGSGLDVVDGKIYWVGTIKNNWLRGGKTELTGIFRMSLRGTNLELSIPILPADVNIQRIVVDTADRKIYWQESTVTVGSKIWHADLDGSNVQTLREASNWMGSLILNVAEQKIYWTEHTDTPVRILRRMDLDGSNVENVMEKVGLKYIALSNPNAPRVILEIDSLQPSNSTLVVGETFTLSAIVKNSGEGESPPTRLQYYHSNTEVGSTTISPIDAGQTSHEQVCLIAPSEPGTYYYGAGIGRVGPTVKVTVKHESDLAFGSFVTNIKTEDNTVAPGASIRLAVIVTNRGEGKASPTTLRYYRSTDEDVTAADTEIVKTDLSSLAVGALKRHRILIKAPIEPGTYYYGACIDTVDEERITDNNCSLVVKVTVKPKYELAVESLQSSRSRLALGESFTLSTLVRNTGEEKAPATPLRYYRSTDEDITATDTEVGKTDLSSLASDATSDASVALIAPSEPGTYYYGACVDAPNSDCPVVTITVVKEAVVLIPAAERPPLYWLNTQAGTLHRLMGRKVEDLVPNVQNATSLAVDVAGGKLYWGEKIDDRTGRIRTANLDGSNVKLVKALKSVPLDIALDTAGGKLYLINAWGKVQGMDLDGSNFQPNLIRDLEAPQHLTLDVERSKVYWTEQTGADTSKIRRANLDGSDVELIKELTSVVLGMAADVKTGKLYVTNARGKVQRLNLDGSNFRSDFITDLESPMALAVDAMDSKVYWMEMGRLRRADLKDNTVEDVVRGLEGMPSGITLGIAAVQPSPTPPIKKPAVVIAEAQPSPLYWLDTESGSLHRLVDDQIDNLVPSVQNATSLTVDVVGGKLYWTEKTGNTTGKIRRANLDGTDVQQIKDLKSVPQGVAVDPAGGKVYVTNAWGKIQRLNLDGSNFEPNFITGLDMPKSLALDVSGGKVYWMERSGGIRRANLDGSNVEDVASGLGTPMQIAVSNSNVYWTVKTGEDTGEIRFANLHGDPTVATLRTFTQGFAIGIAVDAMEENLYWTTSRGEIGKANLDGSEGQPNLVTGLTAPGSIAVEVKPKEILPTDAVLSISPSPVTSPAIGERLTLSLNIAGGEVVAGYQVTLQFDATVLRYVESSTGDYLPTGASFASPVVEGNRVAFAATPHSGVSNGDGTLATVTFEVLAAKASILTLSEPLLSDDQSNTFRPRVEAGEITEPLKPKEDVNTDGIVNIQDLVLVASGFGQTGENSADVNTDGIVNIQDLVLVAGAFGSGVAAAPTFHLQAIGGFTASDVQSLLTQAEEMSLIDPAYLRGIAVLEQLLASLLPKETALLANYPNPFNPETWIPYQLAKLADVTLRIYDVNGTLVRTLTLGHQPMGIYKNRNRAAYWDGRNELGEQVASGIYFYTLSAGDFTATRKMLIMK